MIDINKLMKAMENIFSKDEEKFEWTKSLFILEQTCPIHEVGMKNLKLLCYVCPICNRVLEKNLRQTYT